MNLRAKRTLHDACDSLKSAVNLATRANTVELADHQRLRNAANQAAQAAAELNRLVGMIEAQMGD